MAGSHSRHISSLGRVRPAAAARRHHGRHDHHHIHGQHHCPGNHRPSGNADAGRHSYR